jgi:hypothetical protein
MKRLPFRGVAWFAVAALLAGLAAPVLGAHAIVDVECGDIALSSARHDAQAIDAASLPVEHEHCLVCHFQRDLRSAWSTGPLTDTVFRAADIEAAPPSPRLRDQLGFQTPSRAPPFLLS